MDRRIGWSDASYQPSGKENVRGWVPGATIVLCEGGIETQQELFFSDQEIEKIIHGEVFYPTRTEAKERMRELILPYAKEKWNVEGENINEYQFASGHAYFCDMMDRTV